MSTKVFTDKRRTSTTFTNAISLVPSGGGKVNGSAGTYNECLTAVNGLTLIGSGAGNTIIDSNDVDAPVLSFQGSAYTSMKTDLVVEHLTLKGNANSDHENNFGFFGKNAKSIEFNGVNFEDCFYAVSLIDVLYVKFKNCKGLRSRSHMFRIKCENSYGSCAFIEFENCDIDITYGVGQGLYVFGGDEIGGTGSGVWFQPKNISWSGGLIRDTAEAGIRSEGDNVTITKPHIIRAGRAAIRFSGIRKGGARNIAIGAYCEEPSYITDANGLYVDDAYGTVIGSKFIDNTVYRSHSHGAALGGGTDILLQGNTFIDSGYGTGTTSYDAMFLNAGGGAPVDVVRPVLMNNICFDTRSGSDRTQGYGLEATEAGGKTIQDAIVMGNQWYNNAVGDYNTTYFPSRAKIWVQDTIKLENAIEANTGIHKNALTNGDFQVWQENFTFSNPANNSYTSDLWKVMFDEDGGTNPTTIVHSQQTPSAGSVFGANTMYRIAPNGAGSGFGANSFYLIRNHIENGVRYLCGANKKVTVSLYAKSNISGKKLGVYLKQYYGTGGSPSATEDINGENFSLTTAFARYTHTFDTNTLSGKTFGTAVNDYLALSIVAEWGSTFATKVGASTAETFGASGTIDIAAVVVEYGEYATVYVPEPFGEVEAKCMRSWQKSIDRARYPTSGLTNANNTIERWVSAIADEPHAVRFPVPMRTTPTITLYNPNTGTTAEVRNYTAGANVAATTSRVSDKGFQIDLTVIADQSLGAAWVADARI